MSTVTKYAQYIAEQQHQLRVSGHVKHIIQENTTVHSDYEDGYGSVNVKVGDKKFKSNHYYNEEPRGGNYNKTDKANYHAHLKSKHGLNDNEASAVIHHFDTIRKGKAKEPDSGHEDYQAKTVYKA